MKTVKYIRVSTTEQNVDRQKERGITQYIDKCSGSIPFKEREASGKLMNEILNQQSKPDLPASKRITTIKVDAISRLGRNLKDILATVELFTNWGICLVSEKEGISTMIDGKENPTAKMVLSILATLSEYERELILERQREGIRAAHLRGIYKNGGRPKETPQNFISKPKNAKCLKLLMEGRSIREAALLAEVSSATSLKVKKIGDDLGFLALEYNLSKEAIEFSGGDSKQYESARNVKSIAEDLELLKRAKSNKDKLKAFLGASLEPTNYKDIFELHKGMRNCEMTLTELKREFEIHKVEYKKMSKKGAEETQDIMNVIRFFDGWEGLGGYGKREEEFKEYFTDSEPKSGIEKYFIESLEKRIKWDEEKMKRPHYKHLHENR
jgi:DNA invertase Pin-like site-specific DNA recombinase